MNGDTEGVRDGSKHDPPRRTSLVQLIDCNKGGNITLGGVRHRERVRARQPRLPHDIQYRGGCGGEGIFSGCFWTIGGAE